MQHVWIWIQTKMGKSIWCEASNIQTTQRNIKNRNMSCLLVPCVIPSSDAVSALWPPEEWIASTVSSCKHINYHPATTLFARCTRAYVEAEANVSNKNIYSEFGSIYVNRTELGTKRSSQIRIISQQKVNMNRQSELCLCLLTMRLNAGQYNEKIFFQTKGK